MWTEESIQVAKEAISTIENRRALFVPGTLEFDIGWRAQRELRNDCPDELVQTYITLLHVRKHVAYQRLQAARARVAAAKTRVSEARAELDRQKADYFARTGKEWVSKRERTGLRPEGDACEGAS